MHVKNVKTKWAHLTRCQQRIESYTTLNYFFSFPFYTVVADIPSQCEDLGGDNWWPTPGPATETKEVLSGHKSYDVLTTGLSCP